MNRQQAFDCLELDKDATTIIGGAGERKEIEARMAQIRREIDKSTSDYDKEKLRERLATAAIGLLFIGSALIGKPLIYQLARAIR